jgi:regulator of replication initiation timing
MRHRASSSIDQHPVPTPTTAGRDSRELEELRQSCWRMSHELQTLRDTIEVLRTGANSLALENALMRIENEELRTSLHAERAARG